MRRWALLTLQVVCSIVTVVTAQIPTNGLVAWYPFNGNANDMSGNGNNGALHGGVILVPDRLGNSNAAYYFNGIDAMISIANNSFKTNDNATYLGTVSFAYWINRASKQISTSYGTGVCLYTNEVNGEYQLGIGGNDSANFGANFPARQPNSWIGPNQGYLDLNNNWHFVVGTRNSTTGIMNFYVDGNLTSSITYIGSLHVDPNKVPACIGAHGMALYMNNPNYGQCFKGALDDIRIYNRVLSQSEIIALYNESTALSNNPPAFISTPDTLVTEGQLWSYTCSAIDVDAGDNVSYSLRTVISGMSISSNIVSWTPENVNVGTNIVIIRATDSRGAFSDQSFRVRVANVNQTPAITSADPTTAVQNQLFQYQAQAIDPDAGDVLTWQLTTAPTGMNISTSGLVTWSPTQAQVGSNNVVLQVRDAAGLSDQQAITLIVTNVNDAPVITDPAAQHATEDIVLSLQLSATDPDGNQVFWFVVQGPDSLKINLNSGLLTYIPRQNVAGTTVQVRIRATDAVLSDTTTIPIRIAAVNDPPVITTVLPDQFKLDTLYSIPLLATDEEGNTVTWSVPRKPATMSIIGNNLVWVPTGIGPDTISIIATDGDGFDTLTQLVQVLGITTISNHKQSNSPKDLSISAVQLSAGGISVITGLPSNKFKGTISIFNVSGKKNAEYQVTGIGWHTITIGTIPKGTHIVRLNFGKSSIVQKITVL